MNIGDMLRDENSGEERFRIADLLVEGRSYFIALGEDTHLDNMRVLLKAARYEDTPDRQKLTARREAMELELKALTLPSSLLPEPIDWIEVESSFKDAKTEPVLVLEYISGKPLRHEVERAQGGLEPTRALAIVHELALALEILHNHNHVFRDLNPDHIILGFDDIIHLIGTGNIAAIGKRPTTSKEGVSRRYSAPEIRAELSGKFLGARSDIYSLGALLAYLLTGIEPTPQIESPLTKEAYTSLKKLPEGYQLLLAKSIQAMGKNRFKSIKAMVPFLHPSTLPTRETPGFSKVELPVPFTRNQPKNRAEDSKLSAGPLISIPKSQGTKPAAAPAEPNGETTDLEKPQDNAIVPWYKSCLPWAALWIAVIAGILGSAHHLWNQGL